MISAANPTAVDAGLEMLRAGGSAADAAIAVQLVLNLVEPQSSGLGGGAFILHWDAADRTLKRLRRTRDRAGRRDRGPVSGRGPSAQVRRGRVRRPERGRAGDVAGPGSRAQAPRPAALGAAVRARHPARCGRLSRLPAPAPAAALAGSGQLLAGGPGILLRPDRQRLADRLPAQEPSARGNPARHRRGRRRCLLQGRHRRGDRRRRARGPQPPGRHHGRRSRRLHRQGARAGLRRLPELSGLRHGSTFVRRAGGGTGPQADRAVRPRQRTGRGQ